MNEKDRQQALLRLRQARAKAQEEERYDAAALVSGLIGREAAANQRLQSDYERQRELARSRIEQLKKKRKTSKIDSTIVKKGDRRDIEEAVLKKLHQLQEWERSWMVETLQRIDDPLKLKGTLSTLQINDVIRECKNQVPDGKVSVKEHSTLLEKSVFHRILYHASQDMHFAKARDHYDVIMMVELQETQDRDEIALAHSLNDKTVDELVKDQKDLVANLKNSTSENISTTVLAPVGSTDMQTGETADSANDGINQALRGKFEAVVDALTEAALRMKTGDEKWMSKPDTERQDNIREFSQKLKQLLSLSNYEEALQLLMEGLNDQQRNDIIDQLLGNEDELREEDLNDRIKRKEERIKQGMTEEEVDKLYHEEGRKFDEFIKLKRKNILEGLAFDMNQKETVLEENCRIVDQSKMRKNFDRSILLNYVWKKEDCASKDSFQRSLS